MAKNRNENFQRNFLLSKLREKRNEVLNSGISIQFKVLIGISILYKCMLACCYTFHVCYHELETEIFIFGIIRHDCVLVCMVVYKIINTITQLIIVMFYFTLTFFFILKP